MNFNFDDIRTYFFQVLRDCWPITFVTLNGFCSLSKKNHALFLTDNIKMDRILIKILYIVFQVLKVLLKNICKIQSLDLLFLVVFISFYISRYHIFHRFLELHSTLSEKKIFVKDFSFLTDSLKPSPLQPLTSQNPLSVTNVFCQCSLTYHGFSRLLGYDDAKKN